MKIALSISVLSFCLFLGWTFVSRPKSEDLLIAREGAIAMQQLALAMVNERLANALPDGPKRDSSATGGVGTYGSKGQFEVLTADEIYWYESVDRSVVQRVAEELEKLPEIRDWIGNAENVKQNRRIEFRTTGTESRPKMRVLFLCNNLPVGEVESRAFMENSWPN